MRQAGTFGTENIHISRGCLRFGLEKAKHQTLIYFCVYEGISTFLEKKPLRYSLRDNLNIKNYNRVMVEGPAVEKAGNCLD